jgi:hypothetical protein
MTPDAVGSHCGSWPEQRPMSTGSLINLELFVYCRLAARAWALVG